MVVVHGWICSWENGKSNGVVNERESWLSEVLDFQYDASFDQKAGNGFRVAGDEVVFNHVDPVSEVVCRDINNKMNREWSGAFSLANAIVISKECLHSLVVCCRGELP